MMNLSSLLLVLITTVLAGTLFLSAGFFFDNGFDASSASSAKIEVVRFSGGDRYNDSVRFQDNVLILKHAGGTPFPPDSVSVRIAGKGNAYSGIPGSNGFLVYGDLIVFYENLSAAQKSRAFEQNNREMLKDGVWSAGEILILTGNDSLSGSISSVTVLADGQNGLSNNYGFSSGQSAEIQIYHKNTAGRRQLVLKTKTSIFKNN